MLAWKPLFCLVALFLAPLAVGGQEGKFEPLFNGKDLTGWKGETDCYEVKDGVLACKNGKSGVLFSEKTARDCVIRLQYKLPPGGNNGIALHYPGTGTGSLDGMCEIQLLDDTHAKYAKLDPRHCQNKAALGSHSSATNKTEADMQTPLGSSTAASDRTARG